MKSSPKSSDTETLERSVPSIPWAKPTLRGNEHRYVSEAITSTWISGGRFVDQFEDEVGRYCGASYAMTTSNGTTALHLAFLALSIGPGDEVVVPGFGFMAAANVALHMGARPIFSEVDIETWCMSATDVEKCLSPRTKAIVPVHTYGNVCLMNEIIALAQSRSLNVVEDAAEAFASRYKGRFAGTMGDLGTFSFQATKTISTGEGGMVATNSHELRDRMYLFRNHGMRTKRYWHEVPGHNFRLTNMQAALGCAQLEQIDEIIEERKRVYATYQRSLSGVAGIAMQFFDVDVEPVVWTVAVRLDPRAYPQGRDNVIRQLSDAGIETRNGFYAASMLQHLYSSPGLAKCEDISMSVICFPTYASLQDEEIEYICTKLKELRK